MNAFTESVVEQAALDWFRALGYNFVGGPDMPPGPQALRESYTDTIFPSVVRDALARLNRAPQRHHRLDVAGKRAREPAPAGPPHPPQARLPARQAGKGDADGAGAGGGVVGWAA